MISIKAAPVLGLLLFLDFLFGKTGWINRIATSNTVMAQAGYYYLLRDFGKAADSYAYLIDTLEIKDDPAIFMNYANSLYELKNYSKASRMYQNVLSLSSSPVLKSNIYNQLGMLRRYQPAFALQLFKLAMLESPDNETARYNYELLLMLNSNLTVDDKKGLNPSSANSSSSKSRPNPSTVPEKQALVAAGESQTKTNKGIKNENQGSDPLTNPEKNPSGKSKSKQAVDQYVINRQPLDQMGMSPEQALQLLDAMRNSEIQMLQQLPKKSSRKAQKGVPQY
jgi:tetratricopeptide (TPR) repeat protein